MFDEKSCVVSKESWKE